MTTTKTGAVRSRAASARSETNGKGKHIKATHKVLKGLELHGPPELPPTHSWDYAHAQALAADEDPRIIGVLFNLVAAVIGDEQIALVRRTIVENAKGVKDAQGVDVLMQLIQDIDSAYGTEGEAEASPQP